VFWDEFGFSFQEALATTWARIGKRPVLKRVTKDRRALSVAVGLSLSGKIYKRTFQHAIRSPQVIQCLQHVQRYLPGKIILIWDRARIHKSKMTQTYLA
jgi:putative transposase